MSNYFDHSLPEQTLHFQLSCLSEDELEDLIESDSLSFEDTKIIMSFLKYD